MTYDSANGNIERSCDSATSCTDVHPNGVYAGTVCGFCCTTELCNNIQVTAAQCTSIMNSFAPASMKAPVITIALLLLCSLKNVAKL